MFISPSMSVNSLEYFHAPYEALDEIYQQVRVFFHPFTHRKKSFRNLDISFYDSKPADFVSSQKKSEKYRSVF